MYYSITAKKDATIYERSESLNSGIDEILEIQKVVSASSTADILNSRILIKFPLGEISRSVVNGSITNATYSLCLYTVQAKGLAYKYGLEAYPVSQSWEMGKGRTQTKKLSNSGALVFEEEGVSWKYRDGKEYFGNTWATESYSPGNTTGSFATIGGGGTWFTGSVNNIVYTCAQDFDYEQTDVKINVTPIVEDWLNGTNPNEGFIVFRKNAHQSHPSDIETNEEKNGRPYGHLQYFSTETHTVYQPKLAVTWPDSSFNTGSLSPLDIAKDNIVYVKNKRKNYNKDSRERFRIVGREKYPTKTYDTVSAELAVKYMPSTSYYAVKDMTTDEIVIPFNTSSTVISCDSQGNYFDLWMKQFYAERRYGFVFKVINGSLESPTIQRYYNSDYTFKVVR